MHKKIKNRLKNIEEKISDRNPQINFIMPDRTRETVQLDDLIKIVFQEEAGENVTRSLKTVQSAIGMEDPSPFTSFLASEIRKIKDYPTYVKEIAELRQQDDDERFAAIKAEQEKIAKKDERERRSSEKLLGPKHYEFKVTVEDE